MIHIQQESWQWAAGLLRASSHIQRLLRGAPSPRRHVLRGVFPEGQFPSLIVTHSRAGTGTGSLVTQFFTVNHWWYFMSFAKLSNPSTAFKKGQTSPFWASLPCLFALHLVPLCFHSRCQFLQSLKQRRSNTPKGLLASSASFWSLSSARVTLVTPRRLRRH